PCRHKNQVQSLFHKQLFRQRERYETWSDLRPWQIPHATNQTYESDCSVLKLSRLFSKLEAMDSDYLSVFAEKIVGLTSRSLAHLEESGKRDSCEAPARIRQPHIQLLSLMGSNRW